MHDSRFFRNESGSVVTVFAIGLIPVFAGVGIAVDYARASVAREKLQAALDVAVLAGAAEPGTKKQKLDAAGRHFHSHDGSAGGVQAVFKMDAEELQGEAKGSIETSILSILNIEHIAVEATAAATRGHDGPPLCIIALDPSMKKSLEASGGTAWTAPSCGTQVNSTSSEAVNLSGGSSLASARNCFVGGVSQGISKISPPPEASCDHLADPFAGIALPGYGGCDHKGFSSDKSGTLSPGVYCGGLSLKNDVFDLKPGLYVVKDGIFGSSGGATIRGDGVTFLLTGKDAGVNWSGGGTYQLKAMREGPLAGFVIYLDPAATPSSKSVVSGGGATAYEGVIYAGKQKLEFSGGGAMTNPSPFTAVVANNFVFSGGSELTIGIDPPKTDVPVPSGLYTAGAPVLVR